MIQPLLTRSINQLTQSLSSLSSVSTSNSNSTPLKDFVKISRKPRTANPLSISSSAEHIIDERARRNKNDAKGGEEKNGIRVAQETVVDYQSVKGANKDEEIGQCHCSVTA